MNTCSRTCSSGGSCEATGPEASSWLWLWDGPGGPGHPPRAVSSDWDGGGEGETQTVTELHRELPGDEKPHPRPRPWNVLGGELRGGGTLPEWWGGLVPVRKLSGKIFLGLGAPLLILGVLLGVLQAHHGRGLNSGTPFSHGWKARGGISEPERRWEEPFWTQTRNTVSPEGPRGDRSWGPCQPRGVE